MECNFTPQVLILIVSALVMAGLAVYTWSHRRTPGALPFTITMGLGAWWALDAVLEIAATGLDNKIFWVNARYICIAGTPLTAFFSVLQYTGRGRWLTKQRVAILSMIPFLTVFLAWTNSWHGLIRSNVHIISDWLPVIAEDFGPWFWVHVTYSFTLCFLCLLMLSEAVIRAPKIYRGQPLALLFGLALPALSRILYYRVLSPVPQVDLTPFTLGIAGLIFSWGLIRYRLFDIVLVARDLIIEGMGDGVVVLNSRQQIIDMSPAAVQIFGKPLKSIIGMDAAQAFGNWPPFVEICQTTNTVQTDFIMGSQPDAHYFEVDASPLADNLRRPNGRVIVMRDVTERKRAQELLTAIATSFPIGVYIVREGKFRFVNPQFLKQTGYSESDLLGKESSGFVFPEDIGATIKNASSMLRGDISQPYEYRYTHFSCEIKWAMETVVNIQYEGGNAILGSFMDITDRKEQEGKLAFLASHDTLTGLPNRYALHESLRRAVARGLRGTESVLMLFDLDNFKVVNDTLGHPGGDKALTLLVVLLQEQLRTEDLFVRLGGDEFAVLLEATEIEEALLISSRMKESVDNHSFTIGGKVFRLTLSIGLVKVDGLSTVDEIIAQADKAMYEAKDNGRNRIVVFEPQAL